MRQNVERGMHAAAILLYHGQVCGSGCDRSLADKDIRWLFDHSAVLQCVSVTMDKVEVATLDIGASAAWVGLVGAVLGEVGWTIPDKVRGVGVYMSIIQEWDLNMQCRLRWGK